MAPWAEQLKQKGKTSAAGPPDQRDLAAGWVFLGDGSDWCLLAYWDFTLGAAWFHYEPLGRCHGSSNWVVTFEVPSVLPKVPSDTALAKELGLMSCANSAGMAFHCDIMRVSESQGNGAGALHPG